MATNQTFSTKKNTFYKTEFTGRRVRQSAHLIPLQFVFFFLEFFHSLILRTTGCILVSPTMQREQISSSSFLTVENVVKSSCQFVGLLEKLPGASRVPWKKTHSCLSCIFQRVGKPSQSKTVSEQWRRRCFEKSWELGLKTPPQINNEIK